MRRYETIFIADPDLQDSDRSTLFDKYTNLLAQEKGILVDFDDWGNRKLAYEIKKKPRGHYVCLTYGGDGDLVKELERNFRLDDKILKFMTVLLEKDVDAEALQQEIAAEEAANAEPVVEAEAPAESEEAAADTEETAAKPEAAEETAKEEN